MKFPSVNDWIIEGVVIDGSTSDVRDGRNRNQVILSFIEDKKVNRDMVQQTKLSNVHVGLILRNV